MLLYLLSLSTSLVISGFWTLGKHGEEILRGDLKQLDLSALVGLNLLIFKIELVFIHEIEPLGSIREEDSLNRWATTIVHYVVGWNNLGGGASLFSLGRRPFLHFRWMVKVGEQQLSCTMSSDETTLGEGVRPWSLWVAIPSYIFAEWLRCCATNRQVAGSIPDGVIAIFHWHNPSDRTMALGSTQPLTEMSTRRISGG